MDFISELKKLNIFKPDMAILDIGCWNGWLADKLLRLNRTYDGVDIKDRIKDKNRNGLRFFQDSFLTFIPDRKYDLIFARNTFFQQQGQIQQALRYASYLKEGGVMCVSFLGVDDPWADIEFDGIKYYSVTEKELTDFKDKVNVLWEIDNPKFRSTLMDGSEKDWHMYKIIFKNK